MENFMITKELIDKYLLEVFVPGVSKEDLIISVESNVLKVKTQEYSKYEYSYKFYLPKGTNYEEIKAKCDKGLLIIEIPKQFKKIEIE